MAENLKSLPITNLDAQPQIFATAGEGAPGALKALSDSINPTTSSAIWSTYRLCRFRTNVKIKHVWSYQTGIESAVTTGAAIFDYNVCFSDDNNDGTAVALQSCIPSNKLDGTAFTFMTTGYSTSYASTGTGNKLFGASIAQVNSTAVLQELTFKGTFTPSARDDDLWNFLGFTNATGLAQDPGGFFDIFIVTAAAPSASAAGKIGVEVDYVI